MLNITKPFHMTSDVIALVTLIGIPCLLDDYQVINIIKAFLVYRHLLFLGL